MAAAEPDIRRRLTELVGGVRRGFCLRALAEFRIPDLLAGGAKNPAELAAATGLDRESLARMLSVMADIGVLGRDGSGRFSNSEISSLLRDGTEGSMRNYVLFRTDEAMLAPWMRLSSVLADGEAACREAHGVAVFQYMREHPELAATFNRMMDEVYRGDGRRIAEGFDFGRFRSVLDVGGGLGHVLAEILRAHPGVTGGVYEQPAVAEAAQDFMARQGLGGRCEIRGGDFFESVPGGYDACFVKSVIHDWNDAQAARILRNCGAALGGDGRLLVAEQIVATSDDLYPDRFADLEMMVLVGGKERSRAGFEALFDSAGFTLVACHEIEGSSFSVIEGKPA